MPGFKAGEPVLKENLQCGMTRPQLLLLILFCVAFPALAVPGTDVPSHRGLARGAGTVEDLAWIARGELARASRDPGAFPAAREALEELQSRASRGSTYERCLAARALAEGAAALAGREIAYSSQLAATAEQALAPLQEWLQEYPQTSKIHGFEEPSWIRGQPEAVAQAVLAWTALEKLNPDPLRRKAIREFTEGIVRLERPDSSRYPYRAHVSFSTLRPDSPAYVTTPGGKAATGALWVVNRSPQIAALVAAGDLLGDSELVAAGEREALGMGAHLVTSGKLLYGFAPRPEEGGGLTAAATVVENFMALYRQTGKEVYAVMGGVAAGWQRDREPGTAADSGARELIRRSLAGTHAEYYSGARDFKPPTTFQVMDAELGKTVRKAFEAADVVYPGGSPGKTVTVGLENMFWMRFDVDRLGDYYFHLIFLKDTLDGGLVSVMMRIDGDKIFQVPLGGATDFPYVDMDLVDGPRSLREGPHSFGIRFSGLLMTRPAVLDAVVVQPMVERRHLVLPDGRHLLLLHNLNPKAGRALYDEVRPWPPPGLRGVDGQGQQTAVGYESDRRRRKEYLLVPPAGLAIIEWTPAQRPEVE
ncbi:MAG: hypothetical protein HY319_27080 [Armatimonadetes bacterium]|nr:hypothetical protein [Armatimonadota bacterium]